MKVLVFALLFCLAIMASTTPISQFEDPRIEDDINLLESVPLEVDEEGQCVFVKSEEGLYSFTSPGTDDQVCGLYIIAEPDKEVEFEFQSFDISCSKGGLISVIDGWELNGQFFPSPHDHPLPAERRYTEFCGKAKPRKNFRTSQNVGLIEFRVPTKGQGFSVFVRFHSNPKPCNAVLQEPQGAYTLRNYNRKSNCSISVIFPLTVNILAVSVGVQSGWPQKTLDFETGLLTKCHKRGIHDYVEIRGGDGLDPNLMKLAVDYCGLKSRPSEHPISVACGNTAIRLVSSGHFENSVTFTFGIPTDLSSLDLICPSFLSAL
ncbi:Corticotropin-releasing factor-binding like protein [Argiope bruennichi]|uniref:Corticotropin-releasing factor-binding protein n=1 Tax=Argiope bruennichi TaxID=94029 RepID=A0A8T0EY90_ARGBR|nr:Corticotropin-releasing factor-binding like protein [Argiope bruennichi]